LLSSRWQHITATFSWPTSSYPKTSLGDSVAVGIGYPSFYIENVVAPLFSSFVDTPEKIVLDWSFLKRLKEQTLSEGRIPDSRVKDWNAPDDGSRKGQDCSNGPLGMLLNDLRRAKMAPQVLGKTMDEFRISIEVKPKAGCLPFSPLVDPLHRSKYEASRFVLLQSLHQEGLLQKGWVKDSESVQKSSYDPLDLFSLEPARMTKAIEALFACPQNNLRVWFNDKLSFGHTVIQDSSERISEEIMKLLFPTELSESPRLSLISLFTKSLISIFSHERLLARLLEAQKLDILDADGAILVYQRFVELHGGSHEAAEAALDETGSSGAEPTVGTDLLRQSPFARENLTPNFDQFCDKIAHFQDTLVSEAPSLPHGKFLDESRQSTIEILQTLSAADCHFLLANWLFSLAMCDASLFITLELAAPHANGYEPSNSSVSACDEPLSVVLDKAADTSGSGEVSWSFQNSNASLRFLVRLIDCDRKPARKLRERQKRENVFRQLNEQLT
jgi:hypothetical protein